MHFLTFSLNLPVFVMAQTFNQHGAQLSAEVMLSFSFSSDRLQLIMEAEAEAESIRVSVLFIMKHSLCFAVHAV